MSPRVRKLALTIHIAFSVGWLGAVVAYLSIAVKGFFEADPGYVGSAYDSMETVGWYAIVPLCLASLATGLIQALGTEWGLFRHYWVSAKFFITAVATLILIVHMGDVSSFAELERSEVLEGEGPDSRRASFLIHAVGGLVAIVIALVLSIYKPFERTKYGAKSMSEPSVQSTDDKIESKSNWKLALLILFGVLVALFIAAHLLSGGMRHH
ncbi:MAG: DUF2269 domain-containing protein [Planctomycetes bacterium]|nr:DUF2269 domain-containing protein [Planctomycetota bacterium]